MGYTTNFIGVLKFKNEITESQIRHLNKLFDENCRDHPEWNAPGLSYIHLKLSDDSTGIQHNRAEKTRNMPELINVVIDQMQKEWPDFGLEGQMLAQGEEVGDVWHCVIENGRAVRKEIDLTLKETSLPKLNIANRNAAGLGFALGIPLDRQNELSDALDKMAEKASSGSVKLVYTIDLVEHIHGQCRTQEEFIYSFTNHIMWLAKTGRLFSTAESQLAAIKRLGTPNRL